MKNPKTLKEGAIIDVIAPSGKIVDTNHLEDSHLTLEQHTYRLHFGQNILGHHDFLSNTTACRFEDLKKALYSKDSSAIWAYRGGSGAAELLPLLAKLSPPKSPKIFLGFSDLTSLHLFLNQSWDWVTFHGPGAKQLLEKSCDKVSRQSVFELFHVGFHSKQLIDLKLSALNEAAKKNSGFPTLSGRITGGNMTVICHSLGTPFQIKPQQKILLLEDINEPAYKIRRMLVQLTQSGIFKKIKGLILGDFILTNSHLTTQNKMQKQIQAELLSFSKEQAFPVYQTSLIGHGKKNTVIPLNLPVHIV